MVYVLCISSGNWKSKKTEWKEKWKKGGGNQQKHTAKPNSHHDRGAHDDCEPRHASVAVGQGGHPEDHGESQTQGDEQSQCNKHRAEGQGRQQQNRAADPLSPDSVVANMVSTCMQEWVRGVSGCQCLTY